MSSSTISSFQYLSELKPLLPASLSSYIKDNNIKLFSDFNSSYYDPTDTSIYVSPNQVNMIINHLNLPATDAVTLVVAHELGHRVLHTTGGNYFNEVYAWDEAISLLTSLSISIPTCITTLRTFSLSTYIKGNEQQYIIDINNEYDECMTILNKRTSTPTPAPTTTSIPSPTPITTPTITTTPTTTTTSIKPIIITIIALTTIIGGYFTFVYNPSTGDTNTIENTY